MVAKIKKFSDSTLSVLNNGERRFYVYCLTDLKKDKILYIGKGFESLRAGSAGAGAGIRKA